MRLLFLFVGEAFHLSIQGLKETSQVLLKYRRYF